MGFALVCKHVKTPSTVVNHNGHRQGRNGQGRKQEVDFTVISYCLGVKPCEQTAHIKKHIRITLEI